MTDKIIRDDSPLIELKDKLLREGFREGCVFNMLFHNWDAKTAPSITADTNRYGRVRLEACPCTQVYVNFLDHDAFSVLDALYDADPICAESLRRKMIEAKWPKQITDEYANKAVTVH